MSDQAFDFEVDGTRQDARDLPRLEVAIQRSLMIVVGVFSALFVIVAILLLATTVLPARQSDRVLGIFMCTLCLVFFGMGLKWAATMMLKRLPGLVLGPEGITDRSSAVGPGLMPWNAIETVAVRLTLAYPTFGVRIKRDSEYFRALSLPARLYLALNRVSTGYDVLIAIRALQMPMNQLEYEIARRLDYYGAA